MKTIIVYASKHGATREIAERIAKQINGAVTHNLNQANIPDLTGFDCVIIGTSVYAGSICKEAKTFLLQNASLLLQKKTGLFVSGIGESGEKEYFEKNFSKEILQHATAASFLGGMFNPKKGNFFERLIMKVVTKQSGLINTIDDGKIEQFAEIIKS